MVQVHAGAHGAVVVHHVEELHVGMPGVHAVALHQFHAEHALGHGEQALHHAGQREIGLEVFLAEGEALLAQLLRRIGHVPGLQVGDAELGGGEHFQLIKLAPRDGLGLGGQLAQEAQHALGRAGHLVGQRKVRVGVEAQQVGGLVAQRQKGFDARAVVVRAGLRALVGGAGVVGGVQLFAQRPVVGEGQDGLNHGALERGELAFELFFLRHGAEHRARRLGQPGQLVVGHQAGPRVGGVEHGLFEFGLDLAELVLDVLEARSRRLFQRHAREPEPAQAVFHHRAARPVQGVEAGGFAHGLHRFVQGAVLAQFGAVLGEFFQRLGIGLAQLGRILYAVQVRHRREGAAQPLFPALQRRQQRGEIASGRVGGEAVDFGAEARQHVVDGGVHVPGGDGGEGGQFALGQQRVFSSHGIPFGGLQLEMNRVGGTSVPVLLGGEHRD